MTDLFGEPTQEAERDSQAAAPAEEVHAPPKPRCLACDACHALQDNVSRENVSAGIPLSQGVKQLHTPEEVRSYAGLTKNTNDQHIADVDGIEASYDLGTKVECSLEGSHLHPSGYIVRALCGMTLSTGEDCGAESIIGFKEARGRFDRRKSFQSNVARAQSWRSGVDATFERFREAHKARREVVGATERLLKTWHKELNSRAKAKTPRTEVETTSPRDREGHALVQNIVGLTLFSDEGDKLIGKMDRAIRNYDADLPPGELGEEIAKNLARYATHFDDTVAPLERWLEESGRFMTKANLEVALMTIQKPSSMVVEAPGGFRVSYLPEASALLPWSRQ